MNTKKGFTLIELLIVIAIIGILAVAFVPTLLDAPARGRDSQRIANLNTIRTVLLDAELRGIDQPASACSATAGNSLESFVAEFGGSVPQDPQAATRADAEIFQAGAVKCKSYVYLKDPDANYQFGIYAKMENAEAGNVKCSTLVAAPTTLNDPVDGDSCYAILVQ